MRTRVCIADAVTVFRAGVREVLARERDFEVVEAVDLAGLEGALEAGVDIALIDSALPPSGVRAAIGAAKGRCAEIIVWSLRPEPEEVFAAIRAGATGYLRKEISAAGLVRSLRGAAVGESPLSRDLAALMIAGLPDILRPCTDPNARGLFSVSCPLIAPRDVGMSLFLTSPGWLLGFLSLRWWGRDRLVSGSALAVAAIATVNLMHFSQGWVQFGYRFSNDFIPFALILSRRWGAGDLRRAGSGNLGAANVMRVSGVTAGVLVAALDMAKGAASVWLAERLSPNTAAPAAAGLAAIVGHIYPIWLRFRGGKGVATACGVFLVVTPLAVPPALAIFTAVVWATKYISLGSLLATLALPPIAYALGSPAPAVIGAFASAALIVFRHRSNLVRLRTGTERRMGVRV